MSHLYFNGESDYSEETTCENNVFRSIILHHKKKLNISQFTCQFITYSISLGNLDWCECGSCKNEAREIGCLCCREEDAVLIALDKMPKREGSILPSSFYEHLPDY